MYIGIQIELEIRLRCITRPAKLEVFQQAKFGE